MTKKRILTGDRPTGRLHLGHYVGSLKNRVRLQDEYECFFIIADLHTLTTRPEKTGELAENIRQLVLDYLSVGIDPAKVTIYVQSQIPEVAELAVILGNLVTVPRLQRVPTLKDVMRDADIKIPSFGLLGYPVLQAADILMVRANLVPVGRDQASHIEVTREIAKEFNRLYPVGALRSPRQFGESSNVASALGPVTSFPPAESEARLRRPTSARSDLKSNGDGQDLADLRAVLTANGQVGSPSSGATPRVVFPIPEALIPDDIGTLPGTDGKAKMSKSAGNVINLSDDSATVKKKVMGMYTDPARIHGDEPGDTKNNPVFIYLDAFAPEVRSKNYESGIKDYKERYQKGAVKDVEMKEFLFEVLEEFLRPLREKREEYEKQPELIDKILKEGITKAQAEAQSTLRLVRAAMKIDYF